jgi:phosphatidylserine decarboxylase
MSLADDMRHVFAPPHPAGRPFIVAGVAVALLGVLLWGFLGWLGAIFTLF